MLMHLKVIISICCFLLVSLSFAQTKTDSITRSNTAKDSLIDGKSIGNSKLIPAEVDSLGIKNLEDLPEAAELERKWLEELYSNSLFDTKSKHRTKS